MCRIHSGHNSYAMPHAKQITRRRSQEISSLYPGYQSRKNLTTAKKIPGVTQAIFSRRIRNSNIELLFRPLFLLVHAGEFILNTLTSARWKRKRNHVLLSILPAGKSCLACILSVYGLHRSYGRHHHSLSPADLLLIANR